jgi:phenylacetate-coenzyme A ligase PaaK-like adenylate-forming protein
MTKQDLMEHFDEIVTDPRLTLRLANEYVENLPDNSYLFDRYHLVASGGSSGRRGIFVYDWDAFATLHAQTRRWMFRNALASGREMRPGASAMLFAGRGAHLSWLSAAVFPPSGLVRTISPATPLPDMVAELNELRPVLIAGFASTLVLLASEARAGRLRIEPGTILSSGEPLFPEMRIEIESAWNASVVNYWGTSEGAFALPCHCSQAMHLPDDLAIVEPVDETGRPVPAGVLAPRFLLTNLDNLAQPLIRYEVTDELMLIDGVCPCGSAHRRIDAVLGRCDETFVYAGGVRLHPLNIRAVLGRNRHVTEYQVQQTPDGAHVIVCVVAPLDLRSLAADLERALRRGGVAAARVTVSIVSRLDRLPSGKTKRFIPLPAGDRLECAL